MVSAFASSWPSPLELDTPRKKEESLKALKALVRDWDLLSRGWVFCCAVGCSSTASWLSGGGAAAASVEEAGCGFWEGDGGLAWGWAFAGD